MAGPAMSVRRASTSGGARYSRAFPRFVTEVSGD